MDKVSQVIKTAAEIYERGIALKVLTQNMGVFAQTDKSDYSSSPATVSGAGVR